MHVRVRGSQRVKTIISVATLDTTEHRAKNGTRATMQMRGAV